MDKHERCPWVPAHDSLYAAYHDNEWGVPVYDDKKLFEFLILESAQAGLSWRTILSKREAYKKAFAGFDADKVARFAPQDVSRLMRDKGIVRNKLKIQAAITNARAFCAVRREFGSFARYAWGLVSNRPIEHRINALKDYPATIPEAEALARDMKKRGFRFFGPKIAYAHMQATGLVNDHSAHCFRRNAVQKLMKRVPASGSVASRFGNATIRKEKRT